MRWPGALSIRSLLNQGSVHTRVWRRKQKRPFSGLSPSFSSFEGSRAISKPAPNPGTHQTPVETLSDFSHVRVGFWQKGFSRIFIFGPPDFLADFVTGVFLLIFVGKKCSEKSSGKIPGKSSKFTQHKSPTHFCRGARANTYVHPKVCPEKCLGERKDQETQRILAGHPLVCVPSVPWTCPICPVICPVCPDLAFFFGRETVGELVGGSETKKKLMWWAFASERV